MYVHITRDDLKDGGESVSRHSYVYAKCAADFPDPGNPTVRLLLHVILSVSRHAYVSAADFQIQGIRIHVHGCTSPRCTLLLRVACRRGVYQRALRPENGKAAWTSARVAR